MISKTLKPCPFCGGTAMITPVDASFVKYTVFCGDCGVTFGAYPTEEEAARVWNTRHELDANDSVYEAVQELQADLGILEALLGFGEV